MTFEEFNSYGLTVSRETFSLLEKYVILLREWNGRMNLISRHSEGDIWHRHILDSLQLQKFITDKEARIADLGSGAGLPGVVLALSGYSNVTLIERNEKKATFLRLVSRETKIPFSVVQKDIEAVTETFDVVTARGVTQLNALITYSLPILNPEGYCLFLKGETVDLEILWAIQTHKKVTILKKQSITNAKASVLQVSRLKGG